MQLDFKKYPILSASFLSCSQYHRQGPHPTQDYLSLSRHLIFFGQEQWSNFWNINTGWFFNWSARFSVPKWKTGCSQPGLIFHEIFNVKKAPRWLSKFFHFGTENRADQLKKPPCIREMAAGIVSIAHTKVMCFFFKKIDQSRKRALSVHTVKVYTQCKSLHTHSVKV